MQAGTFFLFSKPASVHQNWSCLNILTAKRIKASVTRSKNNNVGPSESKQSFDTVISGYARDQNCFDSKRCQNVATVVACAQLRQHGKIFGMVQGQLRQSRVFLVNRKVGLTACKYLLFCDGMNFKVFFRGATPNQTRTLFCYMYTVQCICQSLKQREKLSQTFDSNNKVLQWTSGLNTKADSNPKTHKHQF